MTKLPFNITDKSRFKTPYRPPPRPSRATVEMIYGQGLPPRRDASTVALCAVFAVLLVGLAIWEYVSDGGMLP